jgi:hypothetical protein
MRMQEYDCWKLDSPRLSTIFFYGGDEVFRIHAPFLLQTMGLSIGLRVLECGEVGPIGRTRRDSTLSARPKCTVFCIPPLRIPCHHRCLFRNASASYPTSLKPSDTRCQQMRVSNSSLCSLTSDTAT